VDESVEAVRLVRTSPTPTAIVAEPTTWDAFPSRWRGLLDEVWAFLRQSDIETGRNVMVYKDDLPNVEVGVEVSGPFGAEGKVVPSSLPAGLAAKTIAYGPPSAESLAQAHKAVREWCHANGHELEGTRWEVYDHWRDDADPAKFETEIYWLVRDG
jgi:effector-binding domain-containing protein